LTTQKRSQKLSEVMISRLTCLLTIWPSRVLRRIVSVAS